MNPEEEARDVLEDCASGMDQSIENLQREMNRVRTGRANLAVLDGVRVDYYGTATPLNQVCALTVADPRLITIKPWDKSLVPLIEKSILVAELGLTPSSDGEIIRLPIPPLTGERRKEIVRGVKKSGEDAKIAIRTVRRDANELLKSIDSLPEDDLKRSLKSVQELTDGRVEKIDTNIGRKEKELLEI
jgi:ribosome recycling factor